MAVDRLARLTNNILAHYDANARVLPWRSAPGAPLPDPYRVWLSEIMLQQTTVTAVRPYFERFVARWPDVGALAAADDSDVMTAGAGLGYYARARNMLACTRIIASEHNGRFPQTESELRSLPGIGVYTAAAIAAIAYGVRAVVVDGNVERVIARLFAVETPLPAAKADLYRLAETLTPATRAGDFAQAMMDLGATICTPRNPSCAICPTAADCAGRIDAERYPVKPPKAARPERQGSAWWIEREGAVLLVRRPAKGLLGGMRALPSCDWRGRERDGETARVHHVFTHFALDLAIFEGGDATAFAGEWWPIDRLGDAGLPSLFAKAAAAVLSGRV